MRGERTLAAHEEWGLALPAGAELFCVAGAVRVSFAGTCWGAPAQVLRAGQSLRCAEPGHLLVQALQPSRCRLQSALAAASAGAASPKDNSLRPWSRRLSPGS
jgi:hypothetical protein